MINPMKNAAHTSATSGSDAEGTTTAITQEIIQHSQKAHLYSNNISHNDAKPEDDCCGNGDDESGELDEFTAVGNGCAEAVSPPSSCADAFLLDPSLAAAAKPTEWNLRLFASPTTSNTVVAAAVRAQPTVHGDTAAVAADWKPSLGSAPAVQATVKSASFIQQAMQTIAQTAITQGNGAKSTVSAREASDAHVEHNNNSNAVATTLPLAVGRDDPMGVRQLYSLPHSLASSCLSVSSVNRRATGPVNRAATTATTAGSTLTESANTMSVTNTVTFPLKLVTGAFSMECFATFYEVALEELMSECERRVANAPASWRDGQRRFIRGDSNYDLATSTLSFDSPRSSGISPVAGHAPRFSTSSAAATSGPLYPPCFPNASHNTHGLHTRELSGGDCRNNNNSRAFPPPPPPPPALQPRNFFFSAVGQARQSELRNEVAAEKSVPALLSALGRHHGKTAPMVFIAALAYLARVTVQCASEFLSITRANWYRLTTTAILVAAKMYDEHSSTRLNAHFARSSGIPLSEMAKLELDFLYLIDFDLLLKETEVEEWLTWMETLVVRRNLMTPLQSYVVHSAESSNSNTASTFTSTAAAAVATCGSGVASMMPGAFSPSSVSLCSEVLPETIEKSRAITTAAGASRTAGLSSEGPVTGSTAVTSPFSLPPSRVFTHVRVTSNTVFISKEAAPAAAAAAATVTNLASSRRLADSATTASAAIPLNEFRSPTFRSPTSSLVMPQSLLEAPRSPLSGVSLPGSATTPVTCVRAAGVPPSPIHGVLPMCPPSLQKRLFSVVHDKRELPSPRSVRQLSQLGVSPPSPLQPPPMEPNSPVGFFKPPHGGHGYTHHPHSRHSVTSSAAAATATAGHGLYDADRTNTAAGAIVSAFAGKPAGFSHAALHTQRQASTAGRLGDCSYNNDNKRGGNCVGVEVSMGVASVAAAAYPTSFSAAGSSSAVAKNASAAGGGNTRWGPFGMVQQVRDVLGVTASLVRGQLNVLAPAKIPEEARRPQSRAVIGESAMPPPPRGSAAELHGGNNSAMHRGTLYSTNANATNKFSNDSSNSNRIGRSSVPAEFVAVPLLSLPQPNNPSCYARRYHAASPDRNCNNNNSGDGINSSMTRGRAKCRSVAVASADAAVRQQRADPHASMKAFATSSYRGACGAATQESTAAAARTRVMTGEGEEEGEYYYEEGYEDEEGEYYEEDEYGYYGEDGHYYSYGDEEGYEDEEGEYYYEEEEDWYEEEEAEAEYFQRCRPPLTHSPPSL